MSRYAILIVAESPDIHTPPAITTIRFDTIEQAETAVEQIQSKGFGLGKDVLMVEARRLYKQQQSTSKPILG